ncbi:bifunctional hydroxymethylpyrimidine kinase/phosphomethylpyrimidine kinase [Arthrobacter sp. ERGS1:01]|uniref:bifunctional hydroxymethylpyrimidine kinase/phosphomethylpyrimidine kinase n=1 Tax=Arthrobacter sp. ERGS1:01 TaxID=1704044 RepID=UPI0009E946AF
MNHNTSTVPVIALPNTARPNTARPATASPASGVPGTVVRHPRVLSIAGSDPSGGAGIQADIKAISAHGGYAMAAITALTAQNTRGVADVHVPPAEFLGRQLDALSADITLDAVKIGMLGTAEVIATVGEWLAETRPAVVVLDPVMVATSGDSLAGEGTLEGLRGLLAQAHLVTPNLPELAALLGEPEAGNWEAALQQGKVLAASADIHVLVKGGHLAGPECPDALIGPDGAMAHFSSGRVDTPNTHGTGCTLSAALATVQVTTGDWVLTVERVKQWLTRALETSAELVVGHGHGPVNHFHELWESVPPAAGAFGRELWADAAGPMAAILDLDFIKDLADGTLPEAHFAYYLAQDAMYLNAYSRVLARASELAPTEEEQRFWAGGAQNCLAVELSLHRDWLSKHPATVEQGPVTKHYVDHLQAAAFAGSYGEVVAAVLPCYWLYAEVGRVLHADYTSRSAGHPYGSWLETYADEAFAQATETAISIVDAAARRGSEQERARMRTAFAHSAQYEVDFFDAPRLHAVGD